jgi:Fe-S cluster assembly iron-binding protein IscA
MGLALDEPTGNEQFVVRDGDIPVILDERLKLYMQEGALLTVDYRESRYGSGFTVEDGHSC